MPFSPRFWVWLSRSSVARVGGSPAGWFAAVGVLCAAVLLLPGPWDADPAGAAKADPDSEREVVGLRSARSKTFVRADGSFETRLTRQSQHWLDRASGEWKEIDSSLVASAKAGVGWESGANRFSVELASESRAGLISFASHGKRMGFSLEGVALGKSGARDGTDAVVYRGVYPDVDVEYAVLPDGVKETLVLRKRGAPSSYAVRLRPESGEKWRAEQLGEKGPWAFFVDGAPEPEFVLLPPTVGDSSFETSRLDDPAGIPHAISAAPGKASLEVSEQKDGSFVATVAIDEKWLADPERVFPVAVDPTVYSQPDVADGWYDTVNGGNPSIESTISVGAYGVGSPNRMGVLTFDVGSIPPAATVSSATLHMFFENCYPGSCQGNDAGTVRVRRLTAGWSASTPWSAISGQIDGTSLAEMTFPYPWSVPIQTWRTWSGAALTTALQGMVNGSIPNYGFILDESHGNNWNGWWFRSSLWGDPGSAPYLEVTWSSDGVQVDPAMSVHSNGAELRWQHYPAGAIPGFKRYEVHRSASAGFTPSASTLVATLTDSALQSYRDTTAKPSSTFWYEVVTVIDPGSGEVPYSSNEVKALLPAAGQATVTVQPGFISSSAKGTYISSGSPNTPQGNSPYLVVGSASGSTTRTLLQFDLHSVPTGVTITDAQLGLYALQSTSAGALEAHRISAWWEEGGATWNSREYQGGVAWATPGGDYDAASAGGGSGGTNVHWESVPVTSLVQDWVNGAKSYLGMIVRYGSENGSQPTQSFAADGYSGSIALRPKLVVTFEDDSTAVSPTVAISQPQPDEQVKGTVTLKAGALDDGTVKQVEFFDGATPIGSPDTTAPYQTSWVTTGRGSSSLTAKATDEAGNMTTSSAVTVTRANSSSPTTSVTSATAGGGGAWTVNASASDDVSVSRLEFYVDGDRFATDQSSPYSATMETLALPVYDGSHTLATRAYDADGNVTVSAGYPISVTNTTGQFKATISATGVPLEMSASAAGGGGGGGGGGGEPTFPVAPLVEDFTHVNGVLDSADWNTPDNGCTDSGAEMRYISNEGGYTSGNCSAATYTSGPWDDEEISLDVPDWDGESLYVHMRVQQNTSTGWDGSYYILFNPASDQITVFDSSSNDILTESAELDDGSSIGVRTAGDQLSLWVKPSGGTWAEAGSVTMSDSSLGAGYVGIELSSPDQRIDNVHAGELIGGGGGAADYGATVLEDDPLSYWRLDETSGTSVADEMSAVVGSYVNTPTLGETPLIDDGTSVKFDEASNERVDLNDHYDFTGTAPFSAEAWVEAGSMGSQYPQIVSKYASNGWSFYFDGDDETITFERHGSSGADHATATGLIPGMHHVVATYDGSAMRLYVDGALADGPIASTRTMPGNSADLSIGDDPLSSWPFSGWIDEVAVYDHALAAGRVQAHYEAGIGSSGSGGGGTDPGNVSFVQSASTTNNGGATSIAQAFDDDVTAGDAVLVAVSWDTSATQSVSVSDTLGNTYTKLDQANDTTNQQALAVFYAVSGSSGADSVTATFGSSSSFRRIAIHEYAGVDPVSPIDAHAIRAMVTGSNTTDGTSTSSITTTGPNRRIFAALVDTSGTTTISPGTGYTEREDVGDLESEDKEQSTAGSVSATWTVNQASFRYHAAIVALTPTSLGSEEDSGQDTFPVTVTLHNDSSQTWPTASTKLRYRWFSADATPTVVDSGDVSIGADLGAGQQRNVTLEIEPPALPTGVLRARYRLRVDLYDTATSSYFAAKGNTPYESWVTVTADTPAELGLERYQAYDEDDLGGGFTDHVNLANGNNLVQWTPFSEPGRGIDTVVNLTYNSLEHGSVSPLGNNWSVAIGSLTPFGLPLDIHPNAADTAAGRTDKWVGLTDGDGSYHRFEGNAAGTYYTAPAGVELYLKKTGSTGWELWKPDRTRFVYDEDGYPTTVADANGNELTYTLATPGAGEDPYGIGKRVTTVTDAGGRDFTLTYWANADTPTQAMRGKLKHLTDHVGHALEFAYYEDGNLRSITEKGGPGDDGMPTPDRTVVFAYLNAAGSGPAIGDLEGRRDPDPATVQSSVLFSVIDFRGQETQFEYGTSGMSAGRLVGRTNRLGGSTNETTYAYPSATSTTVTLPLAREWQYTLDGEGRVTEIVDPLDQQTQVEWTAAAPLNHVHKLVQPTGEFTEYAYNPNGLLVSEKDELGNETTYTYANSAVDANDVTGNWETGRSIGHISQVASVTKPRGNATTGNPDDYTWTFTYTATPGDSTTGLVKTVTDPLGNVTTNTWNANATLATQTLPANGDAITRTTTFNTYDANGLPTTVTDAAGGVAEATYRADGLPVFQRDPVHATGSAPSETDSSHVYYDAFGRERRSSTPKSSTLTPGLLIWQSQAYGPNGNVTEVQAAHYGRGDGSNGATTTSTSDALDRPTLVTGPRAAAKGGPTSVKSEYDAGGRVTRVTKPRGVNTSPSGSAYENDFVTETVFDLLDRALSVTEYAVDGSGDVDSGKTRVTKSCYDLAGDLRSTTAPKGSSGLSSCPDPAADPYVYTTASYTTKLEYDAAHRLVKTTDPAGETTETGYDENGQVTSETDELGKVTTTTYSDRGERLSLVQPYDTGRTVTTRWEYDALGNVKRLISPRAYDAASGGPTFTDYVESYAYDALARPVKTTVPAATGTTQAYLHNAYDADGRLLWTSLPTTASTPGAVTDAEKTQNSYWDTDSIYTQQEPALAKQRFDYTAEGWQTNRIPEIVGQPGVLDLARSMSWDYTTDGLVSALLDDGGERATYDYDANGNLTHALEATGLTTSGQAPLPVELAYDSLDQQSKVRVLKTGSSNWLATLYGYDLHGNRASEEANREETTGGSTVTAGRVSTFAYDQLDRATSQVDDFATGGTSDDEQLLYTYTDRDELASQTLQKGGSGSWATEQSAERTYFDNGLLKTLTNKNAAGAMIEQHTLDYVTGGVFVNGNRVSDTFQLKGPDAAAACYAATCTATWTYDARDRLTAENTGAGLSTAFTLDVAGNITTETPTPGSAITRTYSGLRLATQTTGTTTVEFLYDGLGNLDCAVKSTYAGGTCPASGADLLEDWVYDYKSRLASYRLFNGSGGVVNSVAWTSDPLDRPVAQTSTLSGSTTNYAFSYVGASNRLASETLTGATNTTRRYGYDAFGRRATIADGASRYSYLYEPHGSVSLLADQSGTIKASYGYSAYGKSVAALTKTAAGFPAGTNSYGYTGKRSDAGSGTLDMGARRYVPATGRFLQVDQYDGALDNLTLALDPLSGNRYALAAGNPVNWVELDGHRLAQGAINAEDPRGTLDSCLNAVGQSGCQSVAQYELENMPAPGCGVCGAVKAVAKVVLAVDELRQCVGGNSASEHVEGCVLGVLGWTPVGKGGRLAEILGGRGVPWVERLLAGGRAAKAVDDLPPVLPKALAGGPADVHVYHGVRDGRNVYVGLTSDLARRQAQHGDRFVLEQITDTAVTRGQARAIEEALILRNPGFENIRHSISPRLAHYRQAVDWGNAWLRRNGY